MAARSWRFKSSLPQQVKPYFKEDRKVFFFFIQRGLETRERRAIARISRHGRRRQRPRRLKGAVRRSATGSQVLSAATGKTVFKKDREVFYFFARRGLEMRERRAIARISRHGRRRQRPRRLKGADRRSATGSQVLSAATGKTVFKEDREVFFFLSREDLKRSGDANTWSATRQDVALAAQAAGRSRQEVGDRKPSPLCRNR